MVAPKNKIIYHTTIKKGDCTCRYVSQVYIIKLVHKSLKDLHLVLILVKITAILSIPN